MRMISLAASLLSAVLVFAFPPSAAQAQIWVSGAGSDANDCLTSTTPCRTLFTALSKVPAAGVIQVLPGSYTAFSIGKAVSIIADQGGAEITSSVFDGSLGFAALYVSAGAADVVRIRGLTLKGDFDTAALIFTSGAALHVENCTFVHAAPGLRFAPAIGAGGGVPTKLIVRNSTISGNDAGNVLIKPISGVSVAALFERTFVGDGLFGVRADNSDGSGKISVDFVESIAKGNVNNGLLAVGTGANPVHFMIDRSTADNNGAFGAVATGAQAFMITTNSTIMRNETGLAQQSGATVATTSTNTINFNTTNTSGTITPISLK